MSSGGLELVITFARSLGAALAFAALFAAALAVPAQAGPPERDGFADSFEFVYADCGGFEIIAEGSLSGQEALFTDSEGNQRIILQFNIEYSMTRSDTGAWIGSGFGHSVLKAPIDGLLTSTWIGLRAKESYADGSVVYEVGRIMFDGQGDPVFVAGPHPFGTVGVDRCEFVDP